MLLRLLPRELAADVFEHLGVEEQERLLLALGNEQVARILNEMERTTAPRCWKNCPPPPPKNC